MEDLKVEIVPFFCLHNHSPVSLKNEIKEEIEAGFKSKLTQGLNALYDFYILIGKMKVDNKKTFFFKSIIETKYYKFEPVSEYQNFEEGDYKHLIDCCHITMNMFNLNKIKLDILQFDDTIYQQETIKETVTKWKNQLTSKE